MVRYSRPLWLDAFPRSRRPDYPLQRGALTADVVIVGGGLTACETAYAMAADGVKVVLVEAERIGGGETAASSGLVLQDPGVDFCDVEELYGLREARRIFRSVHRAALDCGATLRRLRIECGLDGRDLVRVAIAPEDEKQLRREWQGRKGAGLEAAFLRAQQARARLQIERGGALQTR